MYTLGRLHKIEASQIFPAALPIPAEIKVLHKWHSDVREFSRREIDLFTSSNCIYKQHIPPTLNNLALLRDRKKVILFRQPQEIIEAYKRAIERRLVGGKNGFMRSRSQSHNITQQAWDDINTDLSFFYEGWHYEGSQYKDKALIISYDDLMQNTKISVNKIESFFGLSESQTVQLSKERYSRHNILFHILKNDYYVPLRDILRQIGKYLRTK